MRRNVIISTSGPTSVFHYRSGKCFGCREHRLPISILVSLWHRGFININYEYIAYIYEVHLAANAINAAREYINYYYCHVASAAAQCQKN